MNGQWHIQHQLELLSAPTTVQYHRIDTYSSIVEGVQRVRRVLAGDYQIEKERLIRACYSNDIETVRWLLENDDVSPNDLRKGINRSVLHEAVLHSNGRALVRLLCQHGADPKQRDSLGRTPLHYAASYGHLDILIELMHFIQVRVSTLTDLEGRCPLMYACGEGHLAVCRWLIEYGDADYHRQDDHGRSGHSYACRNGHASVVEWLLPILPPEPTKTGWHPLHYACAAGHFDIVKILLQYDNENAHLVTNSGHSALFMAMHSPTNGFEMMKYLLDSHRSIQLTEQDIDDLNCDKSLILLLAQRRHSLTYLFRILHRIDYYFPLLRLLLLSEHTFTFEDLLLIPYQDHQAFVRHRLQNPLKLKQILRCKIRKSLDTSNTIDVLEISQNLKKFIRFEHM
ncbi:unnamed protein product [Adineta ricciae]|uniref:Uncharacterized protein n=1 Tax=Adineta ricciae TaxID=249248 RepID=A0A814LZV9_ADIRI|nr:unnamed protein product [Adineta ricciae]CAF1073038.1 unnamed protein product [Adineta ricciae]